jgi:hypothetical protein
VVEVGHCYVELGRAHVELGYHTKGYIRDYMSFVEVVKMEPAHQKQNRHKNLVLMPWVTSEVTSYQAT